MSTTDAPRPIPELDVQQAYDRLTRADGDVRRPLLIDVRERHELEVIRAQGVVHLPLSTFADTWRELPRDHPLLFICATGRRSLVAAAHLQQNGFADLANVAGGTVEWRNRGLPVSSGPLAPGEGRLAND